MDNLQQELRDLPRHPRYQPMASFDGPFRMVLRTDGPAEARAIDEVNGSMEATIRDLQSSSALQTLKSLLREYREEQRARERSWKNFPF